MEKKELIKLLDEIFVPLGFKRKGNSWVLNGDEFFKLINLQKSNYSNAFYINYGYSLRSISLNNETMHVFNRLGSINKEEQKRITDLLDLETGVLKDQRLRELKDFITNKIVVQMQAMNTETDLLNELKKRPHLNNIPLMVKRHFDLE